MRAVSDSEIIGSSESMSGLKGGADWERFDWREALHAVCGRHPEVQQQLHLVSLLDSSAEVGACTRA